MATNKNFEIKNGLTIAGTERISSDGAFTGSLASATTATTQSAADNSTKIATTAYTDAAITAVIGGAPGTLDTLNELAAAINDDASYASTLTTALSTKAPLASPTFTGTITGTLATAAQTNITSVGSLTALDVAGTATMDGLTVEGALLSPPIIRISNNGGTWTNGDEIGRLQFYTTDGSGTGARELTSIRATSKNSNGTTTDGTLEFWTSPYNTVAKKSMEIDGNTGDISFYEDTGTTAKLFWDASAERLGIGTTSPTRPLDVNGSGIVRGFMTLYGTGNNNALFLHNTAYEWAAYTNASNNFVIADWNLAQTRLTIDTSGNVGIGTAVAPGINGKGLSIYDALYPRLTFRNDITGDSSAATVGTAAYLVGDDFYLYNQEPAGKMIFGAGNTERLRIESDGIIIHNGVSTYSNSVNLLNNVVYNFDIDVGTEGGAGSGNIIEVHAFYDHFYNFGYGASLITLVGKRGSSISQSDIKNLTSAYGGSWTLSSPNTSTLRITKTAGTYVGAGFGHIMVRFRKT
jgi:hypothetical protein